ncbi:MAG: RNA ligase RtcB family protein, partial [Oligoflexia bacterium]|nr:RNA ligase RtcB family protein [Oligoflexia bacterium]
MQMQKKIFITDEMKLEGSALAQFHDSATKSGMVRAVAFPDLHPGKGHPVGAAFLTANIIYPYIIGNDIGCGMSFFQSELKQHKFVADKIARTLDDLESPYEDAAVHASHHGISDLKFPRSVGTIGGGNHFAEFLRVEEIFDEEKFCGPGLSKKQVYLLVHSGSRGLGNSILEEYIKNMNSAGIDPQSDTGTKYLHEHNYAVTWAKFNRKMIAERIGEKLRSQFKLIFDLVHNSIEELELEGKTHYLHRKGASAFNRYAIIPGSRGDFTYLVYVPDSNLDHLFSLPHGAGR